MLNDIEIETLEKHYFDYICTFILNDLTNLIDNINSRLNIINDWKTTFQKTLRKGYNSSDLETGAERVFHHFFSPLFKFPNSAPIGSDLMYKCFDALIHIDIKTALFSNPSDFKGKVNVAQNQTSYKIPGVFSGNLPEYYHFDTQELPCLTYIIQIVHNNFDPNLIAMLLICVPNGQLFSKYGNLIFAKGKSKSSSFRYKYCIEPRFKLISNNRNFFRVEILCLNKTKKAEEIIGKINYKIPINAWI